MKRNSENVCVIGAGSSGLVAVKELLDEGHEVICFEKYGELGGAFYCDDSVEKASAYDSTLLTVSNYMMAFSSFPPKEGEDRRFWSAAEYQNYLSDFSKNFGLSKHIQYNSEVVSVIREDEGQLNVVVKLLDTGEERSYSFNSVAVCTGSSRVPRYIDIEGLDKFKGDVYHSAYYKNAKPYSDRKALCIGMGETGVDVVNEIAGVAEKCVLSVRQFQPVIQRFPFGGIHTSDAYTCHSLYSWPASAMNARMKMVFNMIKDKSDDMELKAYADWNLKAGHYYSGFNIKSEIFVEKIVEDKLIINGSSVDYLGEDHVVFKDGHKEEIDMIMLNTGYVDEFSFLKDISIDGDMRGLYKHMIHPDFGKDLVFIGWARPTVGGVPACSEMQARYLALLCSGKKKLPSDANLRKIIKRQANYENEMFYKNPNIRTLVAYSTYMRDFSNILGCSPWRLRTLLSPKLAFKIWYGSQVPVIYRLYGPHSDNKTARRIIFDLAIALPPMEMLFETVFAPITKFLATIRIIKPNPKY